MYKYTYQVAVAGDTPGRFTPLRVVVFASSRSEADQKMKAATKAGSGTSFTDRSIATVISIEEEDDDYDR